MTWTTQWVVYFFVFFFREIRPIINAKHKLRTKKTYPVRREAWPLKTIAINHQRQLANPPPWITPKQCLGRFLDTVVHILVPTRYHAHIFWLFIGSSLAHRLDINFSFCQINIANFLTTRVHTWAGKQGQSLTILLFQILNWGTNSLKWKVIFQKSWTSTGCFCKFNWFGRWFPCSPRPPQSQLNPKSARILNFN